jgi:uncharacterized protein
MPSANQLNDYIGAGFAFPAQVNVQGSIQLSTHAPNLEESIIIILRTRLGERVYRPNFGCRLSELVFEPMNSQTLLLMRLYVEEALETWEPRIILNSVLTSPHLKTGLVEIVITYTPKNTYEMRSMVYPFYLLPPGE